MAINEICLMDATELAGKISRKELSPVEVVDAFLGQIDKTQPILNAFCLLLGDQAREEARAAEEAVAKGRPLGPLHGVPIAIKDLTPTKGVRTTLGSVIFRDNVPDADAIVVERVKNAGAVMVGKTLTPEFGCSGFARNLLSGYTPNPWNFEHTPGGSSGGSTTAVAAGMVPLAEGTDGAGSVRIPASCTGVYGLKPHFGRIPLAIVETHFESLLSFGPITWTVRDAARLLSVWAGPDDRDPLSLPDMGEDYVAALEGGVGGMRVAYSDLGFEIDPKVSAVVDRAAAKLEDLGCGVERVEIDGREEAWEAQVGIWQSLIASVFGEYVTEHRHQMTDYVPELIRRGQGMTAVDYHKAQAARSRYYDKINGIFQEYDFIVSPTIAVPPPSVHSFTFGPQEVNGKQIDPYIGWLCTWPFNLTMHPAASIPAGFTPEGLPVGLQIAGRRFAEGDVLRLSARFEEAAPWANERPPVALDQAKFA